MSQLFKWGEKTKSLPKIVHKERSWVRGTVARVRTRVEKKGSDANKTPTEEKRKREKTDIGGRKNAKGKERGAKIPLLNWSLAKKGK